MRELISKEYQRIIAELSAAKVDAELEALEFRTRLETSEEELAEARAQVAELRAGQSGPAPEEAPRG